MNKSRRSLVMGLPMCLLTVLGASLAFISCNDSDSQSDTTSKAPTKVLYVTFEPGKYHDYTPQKNEFMKTAAANEWETTVLTGTHDEVINKLATDTDFGAGYDVIVYNFCFARCANLNVPYNIIEQTKTKGIPAMLIHCTLHSFWPTYKVEGEDAVHTPGAHETVHTSKDLLTKWTKENPGKEFPAWTNFTGIASTTHGPKEPVKTVNLEPEHGSLRGVPEYEAVNAELYNNFITAAESKETLPLMKGLQGTKSAVIMWEHPVGKSKTISFTLGHSTAEWQQAEFLKVIESTVNYLAKNPSSAKN